MAARGVHCIVVTEADDLAVWGVISDLDLVAAAGVRDLDAQSAGGSAATPAVAIAPDDTLQRAAQMMTEHAAAHLLVVDDVSGRARRGPLDARHGARAGGAKPAMSRRGARWARHAYGLGLVLAAALALVQLGAARPGGIPLRPCTLGGVGRGEVRHLPRAGEPRPVERQDDQALRSRSYPHATAARARTRSSTSPAGPGARRSRTRSGCTGSSRPPTRPVTSSSSTSAGRATRTGSECPLPRKPSAPHRRRSARTSRHASRGSTTTSGSTRPRPRWRTSPT